MPTLVPDQDNWELHVCLLPVMAAVLVAVLALLAGAALFMGGCH